MVLSRPALPAFPVTLLLALHALAGVAAADDPRAENPFGRLYPPRIYTTERLRVAPPSIDGRLDESAWEQGEWAGDFVQYLPAEGAKPSQPTELKILYDERHVYVAMRVFDDPARVTRQATRRDNFGGDIVGICFDSYNDKRTGFEFDLNAAGGKIDLVLTNEGWDTSWDAVWDGKVGTTADGWVAEFRIPLSQLRYGSHEEQVWGLHAWRWIERFQEESQWNLIPRNSTGRMYNLGELHGIRGLPRSRHVELLPHVVAQADARPRGAGATAVDGVGAAGLDAKVALTSDVILDATVNPDFGQVEADPSVVNLTTYETFFEEKRPFFVEGKRILSFGLDGSSATGDDTSVEGDQVFYSRRIGQPPRDVRVGGGEVGELPDSTSIVSAVKVTGKTRDGLSIGLLQSLTASERAPVTFQGITRREVVQPRTHYVVARVQKDWAKGNTILGGMFTSTNRADTATALLQPTDAVTGAVDVVQFLANRSYVVEAKGIFSRVGGDAAAIRELQANPVHYYQRPDADYLGVDEDATFLAGHGGTVRVARYGNSKWRWGSQLRWMSPGLDLNDVGYLREADAIRNEATFGFEETEPRGPFREYHWSVSRDDAWTFGGVRTDGETEVEAWGSFRNKWSVGGGVEFEQTRVDTRLLRGGPAMATTGSVGGWVSLQSDASRRLHGALEGRRDAGTDGGSRAWETTARLRVRASRMLSVTTEATYERNVDDLQYVETAVPEAGSRYVLGRLDQDTLGLTLRADLHLTPELSIQYYGSPFVSNGRYSDFKRATTTPRAERYAHRFRPFGAEEIDYRAGTNDYAVREADASYVFANPDFSVREFRSNLVTRWEFTPGSSVYLVWSQGRAADIDRWAGSLGAGLRALRDVPATNVFLVKFSYWFGL